MTNKKLLSNLFPKAIVVLSILLFTIAFIRGNILVKRQEKELNPKKQIDEAQATEYSLKEIDGKTGLIRWQLKAKEGMTENNLEGAFIKDINAEVYKNNDVVFELTAPFGKGNTATKEIYLFGEVTAMDKNGNFLLKSRQLALGMGTSIEAQKGFNIILKNSGTIEGDDALVNDDQTKIKAIGLKEAHFKDIILSGNEVNIERDKNGSLIQANISNGGKVILKNNDTLSADTIIWDKSGEVKAISNVILISGDKTFKAGYLLLKDNNKVYAKNNVAIIHGETRCFGNSLSFENNSIVTLSNKPRAFQEGKEIIADKIVYDVNTHKVEAIGNVKTILIAKAEKL